MEIPLIGINKPFQTITKSRLPDCYLRKSHLKGKPLGYDDWAVYPVGDCTTTRYDLSRREKTDKWLLYRCGNRSSSRMALHEKRSDEKPFMLMVQHKAPHRNWMPALRHLSLHDIRNS